jgi:dTDP-4-dehydrorhamnose reductase
MRVLILGGSGMLGHKIWQRFSPRFETYVTFRRDPAAYLRYGLFDAARSLGNVTTEGFEELRKALAVLHPDVVVNCIGIVKQDAAAKDACQSISVNALFPHRLAQACRETGTRLIHLSTDCVFSGDKGNYAESDKPDAEDLYGRTKLLGEVAYENSLTIRTSMIGRELAGSHGLVEWFLAQAGKQVRGFKRAVFSGFTTAALSDVIADIIEHQVQLSGVWHVAAEPINKFELLTLIKQVYDLDVQIHADETFTCDRSLNAARFRLATSFRPPSWPQMIEQLHEDTTPYEKIRRIDA